MSEESSRRFTRFSPTGLPADGYSPMPKDGLCLSSFVLVAPRGRPQEVLVGRIDPSADWGTIGGLDPGRVRSIGDRWMLPSSQLVFFESPHDAARRILREQLGTSAISPGEPRVVSETYQSRRHPEQTQHWDLHFIYRSEWPETSPPHHPAWRELTFLDPATTPRAKFARSHEDILELAGYRIG